MTLSKYWGIKAYPSSPNYLGDDLSCPPKVSAYVQTYNNVE